MFLHIPALDAGIETHRTLLKLWIISLRPVECSSLRGHSIMSKTAPLAYSYSRFSSAEQAKGDSLRRQEEARDAWLAKAGAKLDTSLTLRDEGVSAFSGK